MSKKIFMPKNDRSGGRSSAKLLLWPAIALIVLVLLVTLIMQPKDNQETARKAPTDNGAIMREIPRLTSPEETAPAPGQSPAEDKPEIALQEPKSLTPEHQVPPSAPGAIKEWEAPGKEWETPAEPAPSSLADGMRAGGDPALHEELARPDLAPQKPDTQLTEKPTLDGKLNSEPKTGQNGKGVLTPPNEVKGQDFASVPSGAGKLLKVAPTDKKTVSETARTVEEPKRKTVSGGKNLFAVQVGSFKEKQNADEIRSSLQKKGYDVVMKTRQDSKFGQIYVVQLKPVANKGTASTLMEQVKNEQKVQPMIIEMPGGANEQ
jgi:cell division protein FtsN